MAKALKTVAIVAGVAALVVVTGGAAAGLGVALGTSVLGVSAGALLAGSALASTAAGLLTKGPKVPTSQTDRLTASIDPRAFRKTVLGSTAFPVDVRYEEWSGNDQEYCDWIVAHASHAVDGLDEIWLNTDLAWTAAAGVTPKFAGYFSVPNIILEGSPANAFTFASGKWNGSARLTGCAYSRLRFKVTGNSKKATSPFSSGIPNRITIIGRGAKLYDPRRDSTVPGGSGPMRHDDQSTWRYTADDGAVIGENLPLHALRVVLGWRIRNPVSGQMKLATGSGVPGRRLNLASWITAANIADEAVNRSTGGTEPRYHGAGVISEGDDPQTPLDAICAACCGRFRDTNGKLSFSISHNDLAAAATDDGLNDDDVIGPFTWDPDPSLAGTPNVVRGRYVDATSASLYQLIDYPEVRLASPDGQDRIFPLDLGYVESPSHAQRVGKQVLQRKQYQREFTAPFDIRAWKYAVGDVVPFTFAPLSFNRKLFRVKEQEQGQGSICNMTLTVEHAQIYAFDKDDAAPVVAAEPNVYDATKNPLILAIEDASTTADWTGVTGVAKPADNATNSADPNSPFGPGGTVGDVQRAIDAAKARQDALENDTIPAVNKAVKDAGDRITAARAQADKALSDLGAEAERLDSRIDAAVASGGYDDTGIRAEVGQASTAAADAKRSVADLRTNVAASFRGVDDTLATYDERITTLSTGAESFGTRATSLEAQMRGERDSNLLSRISASEIALTDGRFATTQRTAALEAQVNFAADSGLLRTVNARIEDRATAIADSKSGAVAQTVQILEARAPGSGAVNRNPYFGVSGWTGFEPPFWSIWNGNRDQFGVSANAGRYSATPLNMVRGAGAPVGLSQALPNLPAGWYVVEAEVELVSGAWRGAGVHCNFNNGSVLNLSFGDEADLNGLVHDGTAYNRRSWSVLTRNGVQGNANFYAMGGWGSFGDIGPAAFYVWHKCVIRPATAGDLKGIDAVARVEQSAGAIFDLQGKAAAYVRILADAGNGRAALSLWSDQYGGAWSLTGDGLIDGNLTINGTLKAKAFDRNSMSRYAQSVWTGSLTPSRGSRVLVPWSLGLSTISAFGRFIYEFVAVVQTNEGQRITSTHNGKPYYIDYVSDTGGLEVICLDPQGNGYRPRANGSDPVLATADFAPLFQASIGNGSYDTGIIDDGDYYMRQIAATYTVTRIDLRLTWVAV